MSISKVVTNTVVDFIEAYHTAVGDFPRRSEIVNTITIAANEEPTPIEVDELLESENFIKSLDERGIVPPWVLTHNPVGLTREQLAVVASLNNIKDRRSDSKKLADLGISNRKYAGWIHNKSFSNYMKISANNLHENMEAEAHMGLLRSLGNNNTQAQKLYFEMTGRWNPAYESNVNLQVLMTRFIEIIQKHVHDPEALGHIAADLQLAAVETGAVPTGSQKKEIGNSKRLEVTGGPVDEKFNQPKRGINF